MADIVSHRKYQHIEAGTAADSIIQRRPASTAQIAGMANNMPVGIAKRGRHQRHAARRYHAGGPGIMISSASCAYPRRRRDDAGIEV